MKVLKVRNLYGYPSYSEYIRKYAKSIDALFILDRLSFLQLSKAERLSKRPKILVDTFTALLHSEVPIIGYKDIKGFFHKDSRLPHKDQLVENVCSVKIAANLKRIPPDMLVKVLTAKVKTDFFSTLDPSTPEHNVVKNMFSRFLPPSLHDPFTPPKTSAGSRVEHKKAREAKMVAEIGTVSKESVVHTVPEVSDKPKKVKPAPAKAKTGKKK